jgi:glycosyltransferase involved in cell wall biosynthesis
MDEEPYNLATWLALTAAARLKIPSLFFSWQNLLRRDPPPFRWMEQANYRHAAAAIAGNLEAAQVLRSKGFAREILVLPQFGVDPHAFSPAHGPQETPDNSTDDPTGDPTAGCLQIGYAGGLLPEKGLELLLDACAALQGEWRLVLAGEGTVRALLHKQAARLGIETRVVFAGRIPSGQMPAFLRTLDVLVLPSRTTPSWKEQFGRVLIEAMASGVAVVGSDSGEIPHVIGDAGLVFAEGDVDALRAHLQFLMDTPAQRIRLAKAGRARVVDRFTMRHVAVQTVALYQRVATAT